MASIWRQTASAPARPPLEKDLETEAAVIGGGMAGILTAHLLQEAGISTVVLEADRVGSGQSGNTTAKVTAQHGMLYHRLERTLGADAARLYAGAHLEALEWYQQLIWDRRIDCGWERLPAYLYAVRAEGDLLREAAAQERAGLPVRLTGETGLPFRTAGAVRCANQAQFHPLRLLYALSEGLTVYEKTRVLAAEGDQLQTGGGAVRARYIVFCCHFPFVNVPGYYFLRMHQERSYVLALEGAPEVPGMYISADQGGLSLRRAEHLLLVGGGGHRTGEHPAGGIYEALLRSCALLFPGAAEAARWSAQDCVTLDGMPYIGQFSAATPGWYAATGFGKWGMTASMAAAHLIRDLILGQENAWAALFSPQRFHPAASAGQLLREGIHAARGLTQSLLPAGGPAAALPPGRGGIVALDGEKAGAYRAPGGALCAVRPRCPHLGCQLAWNPDEESWDCPCHGSRFDRTGRLIAGPAQTDLAAK